jgi:predicted  nucleic acid-binding Zn-ribbon protein
VIKHFTGNNADKKKLNEIRNSIEKVDSKITDIEKSLSSLYMDKVKGVLTEDEFIILKTGLSNEINPLIEQKAILNDELNKLNTRNDKIDKIISAAKKHAGYEELTFEIVNDFIDCIYIHETDTNNGQHIEIELNI